MMGFGDWGWWIAACVLLIGELLLPGVFLVWFGLAAIVLGVLHYWLPLPFVSELAIFGLLAVVFALVGRMLLNKPNASSDPSPALNQRQFAHVGRRYKLAEPIRDGVGSLILDDTQWQIAGPDLDAGAWVEVTGADGARLTVKEV